MVGASHVAMPLVTLARALAFRTIVIDGRPRFATRERFPDVDDLRIGIPSELVRDIPLIASTALVLVAHDYKYDVPVLKHALTTPVGYIGLLGSSRRGAAILNLLREDGVPEEQLGRVRVPIGLDLGAQSAPEIALAVLAEVLAVQREGDRAPHQREGPPGDQVKALALRHDGLAAGALAGRIACHDVRDAGGKIVVRKGQTLDAATAALALTAPWEEIHVLELEPGDVHEEPAGARIAQAAAGDGVEVRGYTGGQWTLAAARRGLVRVRDAALAETNAQPGVSVFTLWDLQPVDAGEVVAKAKVTPLAIAERTVKQVEGSAWGAGGLVTVPAFRPAPSARYPARASSPSSAHASRRRSRRRSTGSDLASCHCATRAATRGRWRATSRRVIREGADLVIVAGASALDPLDPVFLGIERAGGRMERHGVPAHPGSLLFLAWIGERPVLGMPTCGMFSQATTFDLVLPRLLAGERLDNLALAALGQGGLMSAESAWRFPPYRKNAARGELDG